MYARRELRGNLPPSLAIRLSEMTNPAEWHADVFSTFRTLGPSAQSRRRKTHITTYSHPARSPNPDLGVYHNGRGEYQWFGLLRV